METKTAGRSRIWNTPDRKLNNKIIKKFERDEVKKKARLNKLKTIEIGSDTAVTGEVPWKETKYTTPSKHTKIE